VAPGVRPVLVKLVTSAPTCARKVKVVLLLPRKISKRFSLFELSCQVSWICPAATPLAVKFVGPTGTPLVVVVGLALTVLENAEAPAVFAARTR